MARSKYVVLFLLGLLRIKGFEGVSSPSEIKEHQPNLPEGVFEHTIATCDFVEALKADANTTCNKTVFVSQQMEFKCKFYETEESKEAFKNEKFCFSYMQTESGEFKYLENHARGSFNLKSTVTKQADGSKLVTSSLNAPLILTSPIKIVCNCYTKNQTNASPIKKVATFTIEKISEDMDTYEVMGCNFNENTKTLQDAFKNVPFVDPHTEKNCIIPYEKEEQIFTLFCPEGYEILSPKCFKHKLKFKENTHANEHNSLHNLVEESSITYQDTQGLPIISDFYFALGAVPNAIMDSFITRCSCVKKSGESLVDTISLYVFVKQNKEKVDEVIKKMKEEAKKNKEDAENTKTGTNHSHHFNSSILLISVIMILFFFH